MSRLAGTRVLLALLSLVLLAVLGGPLETGAQPLGRLENPGPDSFQSGIGVISGWVCEAEAVVIEINGEAQGAAYGTERLDTLEVCGDTANGFGLLFNWNLLGEGEHTVVARVDGAELGRATVTILDAEDDFVEGLSGEGRVEDFPMPGETVLLEWQESVQNFVIVAVDPAPEPAPGGSGGGGGENTDIEFVEGPEGEKEELVTGQQQEEASDDIGDDVETAGTISVGMSWVNKNPVVGRIDHADDEDWYRVDLLADHRYQIDIRGQSSQDYFAQYPDEDFTRDHGPNVELTLPDPLLRGLYDAEGRYIPGTQDNVFYEKKEALPLPPLGLEPGPFPLSFDACTICIYRLTFCMVRVTSYNDTSAISPARRRRVEVSQRAGEGQRGEQCEKSRPS